jgi:ferritin-like metal-binding protein YciE
VLAGNGLAGLVQEADNRLHEAETPDARDAAVAAMAQRLMQGQAARYSRARRYARRLDHADEARLLQETIDEDSRADSRLSEIAAGAGVWAPGLSGSRTLGASPSPSGKLR